MKKISIVEMKAIAAHNAHILAKISFKIFMSSKRPVDGVYSIFYEVLVGF